MCILPFFFLAFLLFVMVLVLVMASQNKETKVIHHQYPPPPPYPPQPYPPQPYPPQPYPPPQMYPVPQRAPAGNSAKTSVIGADMIYLEGATGRMEILVEGDTFVGRESDNAIVVADGGASRRHARLLRTGRSLEVTDLGSGNGTFVNDVRLAANVAHRVRQGDRIRFGSATHFTVGGAA
jgi:pSer/pThr/pTyr-binding forkhead associated (FHA) protein